MSASGLSPDSTTQRARRGPALTILTVSEDARGAGPERAELRGGQVYLARSTFALANVILELVRHFSGMRPAGGGGHAAGGKNPCAFRGMIATADPTRTWVSNSKLERRI